MCEKKRYIRVLLLILFSALISCTPQQPTPITPSVSSIKVVTDNNYPPYAFLNEDGDLQGILVDQWALWEENTGVNVELIGLPWGEALSRMEAGEFDVIDTLFYTSERAKIFKYAPPYAEINVRIFFRKNISGIANARNLTAFRVAVKNGDANVEYLLERNVTSLVYYDSYEAVVQAAANESENIFVVDEPPALYFLYLNNIQDEFNYSEPLYSGEFHRAVLKDNIAMLNLVNEGFATIGENEYQQIDERWFGTKPYNALMRIAPYVGLGIGLTLFIILALTAFNRTLQKRIKERTKELEETLLELKRSETIFRDSIEFLPIPISISNNRGEILKVNQKFTENYGYQLTDMPTIAEWLKTAYPDPAYYEMVISQWEKDVAKALSQNTNTRLREYQITDKDGNPHDAEIIMRPVGNLWVASFAEITERKTNEKKLIEAYEITLEGWAKAIELRDKETEGHTRRVTELTVRLADACNIPAEEFVNIRRGAILHDIGKLAIPDNILLKPAKLTDAEWKIMIQHPQLGYELLAPIEFLRDSLDIVLYHHEKWDGSGYPKGLHKEEIPLHARIFALVDVWDATQSDRPYKKAWSKEKTIATIKAGAGQHFDPDIVDIFLSLVKEGEHSP